MIDDIQGYESAAVRLRLMAPVGVPPTEDKGATTFELPFPAASGLEVGVTQAECVPA